MITITTTTTITTYNCQLLTVNRQPSTVNRQLLTVNSFPPNHSPTLFCAAITIKRFHRFI
jgi:hypothetical protein